MLYIIRFIRTFTVNELARLLSIDMHTASLQNSKKSGAENIVSNRRSNRYSYPFSTTWQKYSRDK